jgi:hypothetical protein
MKMQIFQNPITLRENKKCRVHATPGYYINHPSFLPIFSAGGVVDMGKRALESLTQSSPASGESSACVLPLWIQTSCSIKLELEQNPTSDLAK